MTISELRRKIVEKKNKFKNPLWEQSLVKLLDSLELIERLGNDPKVQDSPIVRRLLDKIIRLLSYRLSNLSDLTLKSPYEIQETIIEAVFRELENVEYFSRLEKLAAEYMEMQERNLDDVKKGIEAARERSIKLTKELKKLSSYLKLKKELEEKLKKLATLELQIERYKKEIREAEQEVKAIIKRRERAPQRCIEKIIQFCANENFTILRQEVEEFWRHCEKLVNARPDIAELNDAKRVIVAMSLVREGLLEFIEDQIDENRKELESRKKREVITLDEIAKLDDQLKQLESARTGIEESITNLNEELAKFEDKLWEDGVDEEKLNKLIEDKEREVRTLQRKKNSLVEEMDALKTKFEEKRRELYRDDKVIKEKVVLQRDKNRVPSLDAEEELPRKDSPGPS